MNGIKPLNLIILASVIAVAGKWSKQQKVDQKMIVGGAVLALTIGFMSEAQPKLAEPFAYLILVAVLSSYGEDLFTTVGDVVTGKSSGTAVQRPGSQSNGRSV